VAFSNSKRATFFGFFSRDAYYPPSTSNTPILLVIDDAEEVLEEGARAALQELQALLSALQV
jgi:hypothetical protein